MAEIYGHKWVSSYGEKPNHAWTVGLRDIPPIDIKYGIEAIIKSGGSWPPSLPEFIEYCIGINDSDVIREIHKRYTDNLSTYSDIAKIEKRYFKEVRNELIINSIHYTKLEYLDTLSGDEIKALQNQ
jgi:hypothetical protein